MPQFYSDPERENDPHALPDCEVFHATAAEIEYSHVYEPDSWRYWVAERITPDDPNEPVDYTELTGWYYWCCLPGCMPDSEPIGPFATEQEAIDDARDY